MLSDPGGVDFKPYLIRILATVKRNWQAVIPETARLGRQGRVQIQFAIDRNGYVPKLVIPCPRGPSRWIAPPWRASALRPPFPRCRPEFQGSQVRLQFTFTYNMGRADGARNRLAWGKRLCYARKGPAALFSGTSSAH